MSTSPCRLSPFCGVPARVVTGKDAVGPIPARQEADPWSGARVPSGPNVLSEGGGIRRPRADAHARKAEPGGDSYDPAPDREGCDWAVLGGPGPTDDEATPGFCTSREAVIADGKCSESNRFVFGRDYCGGRSGRLTLEAKMALDLEHARRPLPPRSNGDWRPIRFAPGRVFCPR